MNVLFKISFLFSGNKQADTYEVHGAQRAPSWHLAVGTAAPAPPASEASPAPTHAVGYSSPVEENGFQSRALGFIHYKVMLT